MSSHNTRRMQRAAIAAATLFASATASAILLGPTPYLSAADSPFAGLPFSYFHLENFEDHLLNTPGVTGSGGGVTSVVFGPLIHDSVDADDGAIDGSGLAGDDWFSSSGASGVTFTFSAAVLGALPTHAGIVWTDAGAGSSVTFTAYDHTGAVLHTTTVGSFVDGSNNGETAEDRFFGAVNPLGISAIFVSNSSGGIEVDHLQYGLAAAPIPEPASMALLGTGLGMLGLLARRRRRA